MRNTTSVSLRSVLTATVVRVLKNGWWQRGGAGFLLGLSLWASGWGDASGAQLPRAGAPVPPAVVPDSPPPSGRAQAPFDLTGYWVSLVTRDWRFRMVVPGRGEYAGIPLSLKGKQFADAWLAASEEVAGKQCQAYGAGAIMLIPARLHISWKDDNTIKMETDAGMQTRLLRFDVDATPAATPSWQGDSLASWILWQPKINSRSTFQVHEAPMRAGSLTVHTTRMLPGLIRKNGAGYSDQARLTEYWEQHTGPDGSIYLVVTGILTDPVYLRSEYRTMAIFQKEPNGSKWDPTPCSLTSAP